MKKLVAFLVALQISGLAFTQVLPDSTQHKIDSFFERWNYAKSPGCIIGIIKGDSLIYAKGYGMANLEYAIPNSPATIYHMASVSKEFTGYAMVLLAKQGRLKLDDDMRKYLPWFPDMKQTITIRHLLNHTSGIRDQWPLLAISGTRLDDVITQEHVVKLLTEQKELNFRPGERYLYSNSGYTLCAEIVKAVTGKTLRQFTDSAIFKPLGMSNTHIHDDHTEIEPNRSYSYSRKGLGFANSVLSYSNSGATSLFTNINDMSKWVMNFYRTRAGEATDIRELTRRGKLNNGQDIDYALGIISGNYKGWRQFSHSGVDAGYRTFLTVFPDLQMGFLVFSNLADFNPSEKAYAMADLFIRDTTSSFKKRVDSSTALLKDSSQWKPMRGSYITDEGLMMRVDWRNGRMTYSFSNNLRLMGSYTKDTLVDLGDPSRKFVLKLNGTDTLVEFAAPGQKYQFRKYQPGRIYSDDELKKYTGTYYSDELDCSYSIILKDHQLFLRHLKYDDERLTLVGEDQMTNSPWWMSNLLMQRDKNKEVIGFEVNGGRVLHLKFRKIK